MGDPIFTQNMTVTEANVLFEDGGMAAIVEDADETPSDGHMFVRVQSWNEEGRPERSVARHPLLASLVGRRIRIEIHVEGDAD